MDAITYLELLANQTHLQTQKEIPFDIEENMRLAFINNDAALVKYLLDNKPQADMQRVVQE